MTDKELLTLAAKAIGCTWRQSAFDRKTLILIDAGNERRVWNPLENDDDAFRLAVKLQMLIDVRQFVTEATSLLDGQLFRAGENKGSDPCAATRRAIVRAAAEIGRGIK